MGQVAVVRVIILSTYFKDRADKFDIGCEKERRINNF